MPPLPQGFLFNMHTDIIVSKWKELEPMCEMLIKILWLLTLKDTLCPHVISLYTNSLDPLKPSLRTDNIHALLHHCYQSGSLFSPSPHSPTIKTCVILKNPFKEGNDNTEIMRLKRERFYVMRSDSFVAFSPS